jgi:hypothetical protein
MFHEEGLDLLQKAQQKKEAFVNLYGRPFAGQPPHSQNSQQERCFATSPLYQPT